MIDEVIKSRNHPDSEWPPALEHQAFAFHRHGEGAEASLCICDFTAQSLATASATVLTAKSTCSTASLPPASPPQSAAGSSCWGCYSKLEEERKVCGERGPAPGVCEGMSRSRVQRAQVSFPEGAAQPAQHLTFAVLLNSRHSCSSSLSFLEAITGLGTAKTRYSPASALRVYARDLTRQARKESAQVYSGSDHVRPQGENQQVCVLRPRVHQSLKSTAQRPEGMFLCILGFSIGQSEARPEGWEHCRETLQTRQT